MSQNNLKGFFAYPSYPATISESIKNAAIEINKGNLIEIKTWEDLSVTGRLIIRNILNEIDESDVFCVDLTGLNPNCMFELGYAITKNKKIWIILDNSLLKNDEIFKQSKFLTNIGYTEYVNSRQIIDGFYKDFSALVEGETLFEELISPNLQNSESENLFYLKSLIDTEPSVQLSRRIYNSSIKQIIDDPQEVATQYLPWYATQLYSSICVVCHLLNPERKGAQIHNSKYSLISGMALGLNKRLLMLSEGDFLAPMDYRDLLKQYRTAKEAVDYLDEWLTPIETEWIEKQSVHHSYAATLKLAQELQNLQIGEPIAENEFEKLIDYYFVVTSAYRQALEGNQTVFVGRKGTGKSANFFKLSNEISRDKRNLVVKLKPVAYELQGITNLLERFRERDKKTFAIESLWKFLLISEIARVLVIEVKERPGAESLATEDERSLVEIIERNEALLSDDFAIRLERCVESLLSIPQNYENRNIESEQKSITQALHEGIYTELRLVLGRILSNRKRVAILVDNLDKAWNKNSDLTNLAEFFLGLLTAAKRLTLDFKKEDSRRGSANITIAVFLRSDIFYKIKNVAREPDKIDSFKLQWDDKEQLLRVIEERFSSFHSGNLQPDEIWKKYFCESFKGISTKDYILNQILPRPRDLIYFIKSAISVAINRRHARVEENDIKEAEKQYSQFAIDSLLVESEFPYDVLQPIIYEFLGDDTSYINYEDLKSKLESAQVTTDKIDLMIDSLCELRFLGIEVYQDKFRFSDDPMDYIKAKVLSRKLSDNSPNSKVRYRINPAYHAFLEINE